VKEERVREHRAASLRLKEAVQSQACAIEQILPRRESQGETRSPRGRDAVVVVVVVVMMHLKSELSVNSAAQGAVK